jgi:hypothetical protein
VFLGLPVAFLDLIPIVGSRIGGIIVTPWRSPYRYRSRSSNTGLPNEESAGMKKVLELVLCILHPIAVILIWINLVMRSDLGIIAKLTWAIASIVPFVPFVYVLTGNDFI